jgi:hypothetical protein
LYFTLRKGRKPGTSQDMDVARIATALKVPGLRYRSFGNDPVRLAHTPAGPCAATIPTPEWRSDGLAEGTEAFQDPIPVMHLLAAALPPIAAAPRIPAPPIGLPGRAPGVDGPAAWPLLDAVTRPAGPPPYMPEPTAGERGGTLDRLLAGPAPPLPGPAAATWTATVPPALAHGRDAVPDAAPGLLPAARVTAPLAEVLQTLGRGAPAVRSAFDALRLPGHAPGVR